MIEKDAYKAEKEARERRLMAYSDRIQNRMMKFTRCQARETADKENNIKMKAC